MSDTIKVQSKLAQQPDGGFPLALHERNEVHEDGELFIADDAIHTVTMTPAIAVALNDGRLEQVTNTPKKAAKEVEEQTSEK